MPSDTVKMGIIIDCGPEADGEELERLSRQLRREFLELDIEAAEPAISGSIPEGAKSGEMVTLGTLVLTMVASGGLLNTLVNAAQSWFTRTEPVKSITMEINGDKLVIEGAISSEDRKQITDAWLERISRE
jgi:hypothetical protein